MIDQRLLKLYYVNLKDTSADSTDTNGPNPTCLGRMKIANPNYT